uniref:Uncharacterized protein n=1 Tax=Anguilla anguilla TaxID=7936 RepID=A0A0E9TPF1_ANGAN
MVRRWNVPQSGVQCARCIRK